MAEALSVNQPAGEIRETGKVQVVFSANPDRKGGFIQRQGLRPSPLCVYLGENDCTSLEAGKAVQFGEYRGDVWVVGEYGEMIVAREFYQARAKSP
jgi:hypothetical protein